MPQPFSLCYVTDQKALATEPLHRRIEAAVTAGVGLIQLREKDLSTRDLLALATAAVERARRTESQIVVNDRLDIALAAGTQGVHLAHHSMPPAAVRRNVPQDFLVGASCHSLPEAIAAEAGGADYILFGPVFETPSKRRYGPPLGLKKLNEITARVRIPVLALGGVTVDRVQTCLEHGATGIAGIRLFQECESLRERVQELLGLFRSLRK